MYPCTVSLSHTLQEQSRSVGLHTRLNSHSVVQGRVAELEQIVTDLQAEREILKNTNDRLMKRSLYNY